MGTNFYWHEFPEDPNSNEERGEGIHIGKSSGGWVFSLRVHPELSINTLEDWQERWCRLGSYILDEYGTPISPINMNTLVTKRQQWGGKALLRHQVDVGHCIGHGEGTWDYILGEFC